MRVFKPNKLFLPRNFDKPQISENCYVEIGAGRGLHALQFAQANPDKQLIAIERTRVKFEDFAQRIDKVRAQKQRLKNLTPVHADAIPWLVHALPPQSLNGVFLLYPNPEPKNAAQRWLNMPFFEFLLSRLKPEAKIILATNIEEYFAEAKQQAETLWQLPMKAFEVDKESRRTHFEIKYLARGESCYQLEIYKPADYQTRFDQWALA
ncbi:tRNA (guanosine(46)-N(7))-methyltransferase TrmB [Kangiella sp. TOML190]|uniref:tRNA (guanine(46)-N(7))-methyltransferase TrmB n=1 Tax=Kangiella sp. TOML190 TaxID=2931351 RepID=UPI00203CA779|nr:tRNA (guanine-N(7)-)-methyltransferase [Kangiella sp. TOML190]